MRLLRPPPPEEYARMSASLRLQVANVLAEQAEIVERERYEALIRSGGPYSRPPVTAEGILARLRPDPPHITAARRRILAEATSRRHNTGAAA